MTTRITKQMLSKAKMPDTPTARKVLAKMLDDDDIQDYVRPWKGLTDEEIAEIRLKTFDAVATNHEVYRVIEAKLKEKNT
jgi:hypothetical protein